MSNREPQSARQLDMTVVLAAAAWLIFNSHLERFYPYPWLAADGLLGNSLFFFLSGYGVQTSLRSGSRGLLQFSGRRLVRLYPAVAVVVLFQMLLEPQFHLGAPRHALGSAQELLAAFVWPTQYTYIKIIVPFYGLLWLLNLGSSRVLIGSAVAAFAAYGVFYAMSFPTLGHGERLTLGLLPDGMWWAFDWILVSAGALCARAQITSRLTASRIAMIIAVLAAYFFAKFLMVVRSEFVAFYPVLHAAVLGVCVLAMLTLCGPAFVAAAKSMSIVGPFIALSAALTLEIYVVHEPMTHMPLLYTIVFPVNVLVLAGITIVGALAVKYIASAVRRLFETSSYAQ